MREPNYKKFNRRQPLKNPYKVYTLNEIKTLIKNLPLDNPQTLNWRRDFPLNPYEIADHTLEREIVEKLLYIRTLWDVYGPDTKSPKGSDPLAGPLTTRAWQDPQGYKRLVVWQNGMLLRVLIRVWTKGLPKGEYRLKAQVNDAARSFVRNIEEGYKRTDTRAYLEFLGFSQGSLEEIKGDVRDAAADGFLKTLKDSTLKNTLNITLKQRPNPEQWLRVVKGQFVKGEIKGSDLTVEIFKELINKTEWNLRRLIRSLEVKNP